MMPTPSTKSPHTAGYKLLSLSAIALLLVTGCGAKEELPPSSGPAASSASASASAEASATETQRYSGGSKAPEGEYRAADEHGPAQNVPKPVEPEGMNEESEEGLYKFLTYWAEAANYGIQTGDFSYTVPIMSEEHEMDVIYFAWVENFYSRGGWIDGGLRNVVVGDNLLTSHGEGRYTWGGNLVIQDDCNYLGEKVECRSGSGTESLAIYYDTHFENGAWKLYGIHTIES